MGKKKPAIVTDQKLINDLATSLIGKWKTSPVWKDRFVDASAVADGLEKLVNSRQLDLEVLKDIAKADTRVRLAITAIKGFQRLGGLERIDGIFGRRTRGRMRQFNACDEESKSTIDVPSTAPGNTRKGEALLVYYVDDTVKHLDIEGGQIAESIISDAVISWTDNIKLTLRQTKDDETETDANIVLKMDNLGGRGGVLGIANIGGPGVNQRLLLRFDENETWTRDTFLNTAMHEMGHILGLTHVSGSDLLMSPFQNSLTAPTEQDLARMRAKWGAA